MDATRITDPRRRIALYLLLAFSLSSIFYALIIGTGQIKGGNLAYAVGLMWSPGIAALLCCRFSGLDYRRLGWSWGAWKWQRMAYLVPLGYAVLAYGAIWLSGLGSFPAPEMVQTFRHSLLWAHAPDWLVVAGYFVLNSSTGLSATVARGLGEEIGWRGFLAPHMTEVFGFTRGALLTGVIWALWHMPILVFADYNNGTPWWFGFPCFVVMTIADSVMMAWLRLRSGSLWTAAIFHGSHNLLIQQFFTPITGHSSRLTAYAIDEFGFAVPLTTVAFAVYFWRRRREIAGSLDSMVERNEHMALPCLPLAAFTAKTPRA